MEDEDSAFASRALTLAIEEGALVPSIWPVEVSNGLLSALRRKRLSERDLGELSALFRAVPLRIARITIEHALGDVLPVAREFALSAYDAAYLTLALRENLPLATLDRNLTQAAERAGVPPMNAA